MMIQTDFPTDGIERQVTIIIGYEEATHIVKALGKIKLVDLSDGQATTIYTLHKRLKDEIQS